MFYHFSTKQKIYTYMYDVEHTDKIPISLFLIKVFIFGFYTVYN